MPPAPALVPAASPPVPVHTQSLGGRGSWELLVFRCFSGQAGPAFFMYYSLWLNSKFRRKIVSW